jgi:hypothetical protein
LDDYSPSESIVLENDTAKIEEPKEHTTRQKSASTGPTRRQNTFAPRYNTYIYFLMR